MKRILLVFGVIAATAISCGQPPEALSTQAQALPPGKVEFNVGALSVQLPAWETSRSSDEQVIYSISDGRAAIWVKPWPMIPRLVSENVRLWIEENPEATLLSEQPGTAHTGLQMSVNENRASLHFQSLFIYCNAVTYEITAMAAETEFNAYNALFEKTLNSAICTRADSTPYLSKGALGMVVLPKANPANQFDLGDYQQALALARSSGVQVSHYYVQWGEIEKEPDSYDWTTPDYIFEANLLEGLQISVVINLIHTTVRGRVPPDLEERAFDDPVLAGRLEKFLVAFSDRYADRIHYLAVGNEVNDYFYAHRDEIDAYAATFDRVRAAVHENNPHLPVGMVFAFHDAETLESLDIIPLLNRGDYIAYTLYLYDQGFHFTREPGLIGDYLDRMITISDGTPIAIVETGWSTAKVLDGTEADQAEYVRQVFSALTERREQILFLSWFDLHDSNRDFCAQQALTFFEPGSEPDPAEMEAFVTFLCYFGLRNADGSPKPAWETWTRQAQDYYQ
ncbi:MAG: hypothetical protein JXA13_14235 [Anaerolineales bacterium]|nr:hypothetical protein [Anaerolineales bacterium]